MANRPNSTDVRGSRDRFTRIKRVVVALEIFLGSFALAWAAGLLAQVGTAGRTPPGIDLMTRIVIALVLIGGALFVDGLRRGRYWW